MIEVIKPGLQTTVQDQGRFGHYAIGMPPAGATDNYSYSVANMLVGNSRNAAALEVTYMGPELVFQADATIAICGADIPPRINGDPAPTWEAIPVRAGNRLSFDFLKQGARAYIAVAGGIAVPVVMGSRSTYTLCGVGGYHGRALQPGDLLQLATDQARSPKLGIAIPDELRPEFPSVLDVHVVVGLYSYRLLEESLNDFLNTEWTVTPEANRIGYRYKGVRLNFVPRKQPFGAGSNPSNVVDCGYPIGSIQIPDGVEPIILLNDAVTGGGYATIATVISADIDRVAQTRTNQKARFVAVTLEEALRLRKRKQQRLAEIRNFLEG